jgi:hypothetical protein
MGATQLQHFLSTVARRTRSDSRMIALYFRNRGQFPATANPYRLLWIQPGEVVNKIGSGSPRAGVPGEIWDGDWDRDIVPFDTSPKYLSVVERYRRGLPWGETLLFREIYPRRLAERGRIGGARTLQDLEALYRLRMDPLFDDMRTNGFRPPSFLRWVDAVHVRIGRKGEVLWGFGGNHRLAMAKVLDLEAIPVRVEIRHREWQEVRDALKTRESTQGRPAPSHPDLRDLFQGGSSAVVPSPWSRR